MSYITESLSKNETITETFNNHGILKVVIGLYYFLSLCTFGVILPLAIIVHLSYRFREQGLTNKRIITKWGIISRKTAEMKLNALESIVIDQSILGRIFGFATITVSGRGSGDVKLTWMKDPMQIKRQIEDAAEDAEK